MVDIFHIQIEIKKGIKELVENSLDAGATKIEVYVKEYGKEGVEVVDNGSGISIQNLESIAQKGATSKLRQFQDLESLDTFGFRGEALNAISVLSKLAITTRTQNEEMAHKYSFNQDNTLNSKTLVSREIGTTISLTDLFGNIPVRKQEFNKNIVSQYNKLVNLITEYALISINCQICLVNQTQKKGREMIINSGAPMKNMLQKTTQIFSKKISDQLVELKFDFGDDCRVVEGYVLNRQTSGSIQESKSIQKNITFLYANTRPINPLKKINSIFNDIYKKYNTSARYIYILHLQIKKDCIDFNVSPDKRDIFIKYENEFYTSLRDNLTQLFEKLNSIQKVLMPASNTQMRFSTKKIDTYMYESDDNNKEKEDEQLQLEEINDNNKQSIMNKSKASIQKQQQTSFQKLAQPNNKNDDNDEDYFYNEESSNISIGNNKFNKNKQIQNEDQSNTSSKSKKSNLFEDQKSIFGKKSSMLDEDIEIKSNSQVQQTKKTNENKEYHSMRNQIFASDYFNLPNERKRAYEEQLKAEQEEQNDDVVEIKQQEESQKSSFKVKIWGQQNVQEDQSVENKSNKIENNIENNNFSFYNDKLKMYKTLKQQNQNEDSKQSIHNVSNYSIKDYSSKNLQNLQNEDISKNNENQIINKKIKIQDCCNESNQDDCCQEFSENNSKKQDFDNEGKETKLLYKNEGPKVYEYKIPQRQEKKDNIIIRDQEKDEIVIDVNSLDIENHDKSNNIININKNQKKDELEELAEDGENDIQSYQGSQDFKKEKFIDLQIIGQFNKAFIIAYWQEKNEIFLIDQHASDEKTNYEKLLKDNIFQGQRLVKPIELTLTLQEADILENNRDVFKKNGFSFQIQYDENSEDAKLLISQLPSSKYIQFDINDFDEIFQNVNCEETDVETFRPKKIQRVLASKACRQSIMVGTALNKSQMKQILFNLSNLQSPWNCPHGRPTMVKTPSIHYLAQEVFVQKVYEL